MLFSRGTTRFAMKDTPVFVRAIEWIYLTKACNIGHHQKPTSPLSLSLSLSPRNDYAMLLFRRTIIFFVPTIIARLPHAPFDLSERSSRSSLLIFVTFTHTPKPPYTRLTTEGTIPFPKQSLRKSTQPWTRSVGLASVTQDFTASRSYAKAACRC
ncbi:hypothetical protein PMIN06_009561 [Paraphaeosphaeria minitans]